MRPPKDDGLALICHMAASEQQCSIGMWYQRPQRAACRTHTWTLVLVASGLAVIFMVVTSFLPADPQAFAPTLLTATNVAAGTPRVDGPTHPASHPTESTTSSSTASATSMQATVLEHSARSRPYNELGAGRMPRLNLLPKHIIVPCISQLR